MRRERPLETEIQTDRPSRTSTIEALRARDGSTCQYPGCGRELDFSIVDENDPGVVTIDHWMPKAEALLMGWTWDQIQDMKNLKLMEKRCNAKKGSLIPNEDGTLPERPAKRKFRYRRQKRAQRPEICTSCNAGRNLGPDEVCASCSSGPQPERFPRWAKVSFTECDHELFWCWSCSIGITPRASAEQMIYIQGEGGE